jgi:hypothetical protein|tara:strand:+ start:63 stop:419 length:357 start_codon:yes stop_codon:yes gene_type:complete
MADVTIGDSDLVFGSTDDTWGLIQNLSFTKSVQETRASDADGDVVGAALYGELVECTGTYLFKLDASSPENTAFGTAITLSDADSPGNIYINSTTVNKSNTEFKSIDFQGTYYPELGS